VVVGRDSGRTFSVQRSGPALSARHYGDEGEKIFVSHLAGALPEEYVAVSGLLVTRKLDAEVIVVGPEWHMGLRGQALERQDHLREWWAAHSA